MTALRYGICSGPIVRSQGYVLLDRRAMLLTKFASVESTPISCMGFIDLGNHLLLYDRYLRHVVENKAVWLVPLSHTS